jgi:hypothetical protein
MRGNLKKGLRESPQIGGFAGPETAIARHFMQMPKKSWAAGKKVLASRGDERI